MNKLNNDMQEAIDTLGLNEADKELLEKILYLERINKTKEWSTDATSKLRDLIDEANSGVIDV